jgi:uncharacterized protein (TIGR03067 family)
MRAFAAAVGVLAVCWVAVAGGPASDKSGKPSNGYWKPESVQYDGKEQLPDSKSREPLMLVIANAEYKMYYVTDPKEGKAVKLFAADFRPEPMGRTFEMEVREGQKAGLKVHGIYELTGSQMKICYGPLDKPRPTKFEAPAGSGYFNEVWSYLNPQPKPTK